MGCKRLIACIALALIIGTVSSCLKVYNPPERNVLVFKDSIQQVAKWLEEMNAIVMATNRRYFIYAVDSTTLYIPQDNIESTKVGLLTDTTLFHHKAMTFIEPLKRKRIIELTKLLHANFITRCDREFHTMYYYFHDDIYMADYQQDLTRFIAITHNKSNLNLHRYKIIGSSNNIYLFAYKKADVRVGEY